MKTVILYIKTFVIFIVNKNSNDKSKDIMWKMH